MRFNQRECPVEVLQCFHGKTRLLLVEFVPAYHKLIVSGDCRFDHSESVFCRCVIVFLIGTVRRSACRYEKDAVQSRLPKTTFRQQKVSEVDWIKCSAVYAVTYHCLVETGGRCMFAFCRFLRHLHPFSSICYLLPCSWYSKKMEESSG